MFFTSEGSCRKCFQYLKCIIYFFTILKCTKQYDQNFGIIAWEKVWVCVYACLWCVHACRKNVFKRISIELVKIHCMQSAKVHILAYTHKVFCILQIGHLLEVEWACDFGHLLQSDLFHCDNGEFGTFVTTWLVSLL